MSRRDTLLLNVYIVDGGPGGKDLATSGPTGYRDVWYQTQNDAQGNPILGADGQPLPIIGSNGFPIPRPCPIDQNPVPGHEDPDGPHLVDTRNIDGTIIKDANLTLEPNPANPNPSLEPWNDPRYDESLIGLPRGTHHLTEITEGNFSLTVGK